MTPPMQRIRARLAEAVASGEQVLAGIDNRLRYIAPDDPHREVVDSIRRSAQARLTAAREELDALDALVPS